MAYKKCANLHKIRFVDISLTMLQRTIDDIEKYSIRKSVKVLLNMLYGYANKHKITEEKYNTDIELGKPVKVYDKQPFTDEEIQKLWDNVEKIPFVDVVLILIYTGMRITELLEVENINIELSERFLVAGKKTDAR